MSAERAVQSIETSNPPYRRAAMKPRRGDPNDMEIGTRVRTLRLQRGWSQTELGKALNVTFQQIQKYEKGTNRISAGRLQRISEVLNVPVTFFYSGLEGSRDEQRSSDIDFRFLQTDGALRLVRAYARIKQPKVRLQLLRLAETVAGD